MTDKSQKISAGAFKAKCLKLMDEVQEHHASYIVTKHGAPVAKLVPYEPVSRNLFGCMKGTVIIHGDITALINVNWEVNE